MTVDGHIDSFSWAQTVISLGSRFGPEPCYTATTVEYQVMGGIPSSSRRWSNFRSVYYTGDSDTSYREYILSLVLKMNSVAGCPAVSPERASANSSSAVARHVGLALSAPLPPKSGGTG